jgi:glycosyltransferase involved in cell wall biosynthesis
MIKSKNEKNFEFKRILKQIKFQFKKCQIILILLYVLAIYLNNKNQNENEIDNLENYKVLCENKISLKTKFKKVENPKISIISAVYNRSKYIFRFLRSIQNQFFNDIEIIFVDDFSNDDSVEFIKKLQKYDERIILIMNNENKGTLISRNEAVLKSKGEYLIFPDPDDLLSIDILKYCYDKSKKNNYEIVRFNLYYGEKKQTLDVVKRIKINQIYQPLLSFYNFYSKGYLEQTDFIISNKLIKRNLYIKSINSIPNYYLNQNMIIYEDGLINFMLHKFAKSLYHSKKIGYYYIQSNQSISLNLQKDIEKTIKNCYLYLKYIFEQTKNNEFEKKIALCVFNNVHSEISDLKNFEKITKDFHFYYNIINLYVNSKFIPSSYKTKMFKILKIIKKKIY